MEQEQLSNIRSTRYINETAETDGPNNDLGKKSKETGEGVPQAPLYEDRVAST
jgi:hypothetical protein